MYNEEKLYSISSGVSRNFVRGGVQQIHLIFGTLRLFMMTSNLFVIANVKQLRTGGSF